MIKKLRQLIAQLPEFEDKVSFFVVLSDRRESSRFAITQSPFAFGSGSWIAIAWVLLPDRAMRSRTALQGSPANGINWLLLEILRLHFTAFRFAQNDIFEVCLRSDITALQ